MGAVQVIGVDQSPISNRLRPYIAGLDREAMIESTGHFALGANRKADGQKYGYLFSSKSGTPRDMNVYRSRKMTVVLKSLEIPQAGSHAFRHFNVGADGRIASFR